MKRVCVLSLAIMIVCSIFTISANAQDANLENYSYHDNKKIANAAAYKLSRIIDGSILGNDVGSIDDVAATDDCLYFLDTSNSRLYCLTRDNYHLKNTIDTILNSDGSVAKTVGGSDVKLEQPEGIFIINDMIYIADTGAKRIIIIDEQTHAFVKIITRPKNFITDSDFKPSKIAVSSAGKIYFTVEGSTEGIVELNKNGDFTRFFGTNSPEHSVLDYVWKSFASSEQLEKMSKTYAPGFSNLNIDEDDMVYAVTYDSSSENMIFRFNSKGENVICSNESQPLTGDDKSYFVNTDGRSEFVDIAVSDFGTYAVLDRKFGRVFIYNYNGYLLNVFSSKGTNYGQLMQPSAIGWYGNQLVITDKERALAYVYTANDFGALMLEAEKSYYNGEWEKASSNYKKAIGYNANYYVAYSGLGYDCLMKGDYKSSMSYFKIANDKNGFSKAYNLYRGMIIEKYFYVFFGVILLIIVLFVYSEIRYYRKGRIKGERK